MKLSREREQLVIENLRLVHYILNQLGFRHSDSEYEDAVSQATIALIKAAYDFDESKGTNFSTLAYKYIKTEALNYRSSIKKRKVYEKSINDIIPNTNNGTTFESMLQELSVNIEKEIEERDMIISSINILLTHFKVKHRTVMLYRLAGLKPMEISSIVSCHRSRMYAILKKDLDIFKKFIKHPRKHQKVFDVKDEMYIISFSKSQKALKIINSIKCDLPYFKVFLNEKYIIVKITASAEAFAVIADILREGDRLGLNLIPDAKKTNDGEQ